MFVNIAHNTSLLDILDFYPKAGLTGWEEGGEHSIKEIGKWRFLMDFQNAGGDLGVGGSEDWYFDISVRMGEFKLVVIRDLSA